MFFAATVSEPYRNRVAEVTNRMIMSDSDRAGVNLYDQAPMTGGGTSSGPRDHSLDESRRGSALSSGKATDKELAYIKDRFRREYGEDMNDRIDRDIAREGPTRARQSIREMIELLIDPRME
jgi:hypothetical protein